MTLHTRKLASDYANQGKTWTADERRALGEGLRGMHSHAALAVRISRLSTKLERSPFAIICQAEGLGMIPSNTANELVNDTRLTGRTQKRIHCQGSRAKEQEPQIKGYYVYSPSGGKPTVLHPDSEIAMQEAQRLATKNPGVTFEILAVLARVEAKQHITMQVI